MNERRIRYVKRSSGQHWHGPKKTKMAATIRGIAFSIVINAALPLIDSRQGRKEIEEDLRPSGMAPEVSTAEEIVT